MIIVIYLLWDINYSELVYTKTNDNKEYLVQNRQDKKLAVETLNIIDKRLNILKNYLMSRKDDVENKEFKKYIERFNNKYSYKMLSEGISSNGITSYSINKKQIVYCLRNKTNDEIENIETLMYVTLHELTHVLSDSVVREYEHSSNKEFMSLFDFLLKSANKIGVYKYVDYKLNPISYCGIMISNTI